MGSDTDSGVTMIHEPGRDVSVEPDVETRVAAFVPDSDDALVDVLDEMRTPATVDEVTDALIDPAHPPIETWALVHERLSRDRLPALDASGAIEFDETQGLIERPDARPGEERRFSPAVLATISIGLLLVVLTLVSVSVLIS
ncbi:hypothetical protein [Natrinema altunense]|uniref:Uncharacterized protein n=1 Tax=Natrinema altunense (strain JCM 12890 / CGMCC 1.3731 / AJ2) TaxID=1227494 RepID=L9ZVG5_NATA2|nr:hypothetical protein [Natrinema altunense]ELY90051.1 hypothetical protein C485_03348 [Natrinema altunense JCM 12890]